MIFFWGNKGWSLILYWTMKEEKWEKGVILKVGVLEIGC